MASLSPSTLSSLSLALTIACSGRAPAPTLQPAADETQSPAGFDLREASIAELQRMMERGERSAADITSHYLRRIEALDRQGPQLRAVIEVNPDALAIARALDRERAERGPRGPLHGVPILLKDNIGTADAMNTTAGSLALVGHRPRKDSAVAARLRHAGAVILGKANMSEWANFRSSRSSSGWSARGGQTRNPYRLGHSPCGSSSGSAVAVAANLTAVSVGTETNGSIICPSSANAVVGIKPTLGMISRVGTIPVAHSFDTPGPIARTVEDAAILLAAMYSPDPRDPVTLGAAGRSVDDPARFLDDGALEGARIGVARSHFGVDARVDRVMEQALEVMRRRGAELIDVELPRWPQVADSVITVMLYELEDGIADYLAGTSGGGPSSLSDIVDFNRRHADRELRHFGQDLLERSVATGSLDDARYREALREARQIERRALDGVLKEHRLDAIVGPSGGPAWAIDLVNGDHFQVGSSTPAAVAGYPNITVPAGFIRGLPVGISFFGAAWSEPRLIGLAYAFEQASRVRRPPALPGDER